MSTRRYKLCTYDVWGNADDGYDVNDIHETSTIVELDPNASDAAILQALGDATGAKTSNVEVDMPDEDTVWLTDKRDGKPLAELRAVINAKGDTTHTGNREPS